MNQVCRLALLAIVALLATAPTAHARGHCDITTLNDIYGGRFDGSGTRQGQRELFSGVGTWAFDGKGEVVATVTDSFNGTIARGFQAGVHPAGTYSVRADCTGTLVLTVRDGAQLTVDFVIVDNRRQILAIFAMPGANITGTLTRQ
jgi:hypothetical protein